MADVRIVESSHLSSAERAAIRRLLDEAFSGDFSDDDWQHALGGWHAMVGPAESVVAHAALVERRICIGTRELRCGYVEAVAVKPGRQRTGLGTAVMSAISELIRARFDIGALSTGEWPFYERLGWERWRGPTYVRTADGRRLRTIEEDEGVMVLRCAVSREIDLGAPIICEERPGDSW
ncbi:MAG: GNAT family N-acetyltransferase [Acidobacteria bacterium]|nr:GNAT family N-acetyltransferase [Acidobacteriota bacterium]